MWKFNQTKKFLKRCRNDFFLCTALDFKIPEKFSVHEKSSLDWLKIKRNIKAKKDVEIEEKWNSREIWKILLSKWWLKLFFCCRLELSFFGFFFHCLMFFNVYKNKRSEFEIRKTYIKKVSFSKNNRKHFFFLKKMKFPELTTFSLFIQQLE
jgi:hypothetical protein